MSLMKERRNQFYDNCVLLTQIPLKDGKRETIIKWIYDIHIVEWYSTFLTHKRLEDDMTLQDKVQEIYLMICEISQEKWNELYEQGFYSISAYVTGIVHQQLISKTSNCYKIYDRYEDRNKIMSEEFWNDYDDKH